ncbi:MULTISPECIES: hypothetical protein [unclassified Coleofasciculus]|uniref:hypothetical protein n=1 Tax=unclassified Coleofasciculus TaxID=2692782 RepID=UPI00187F69C4|nr:MULTISPECIES: hypothetical protein [unclassified Coleofasciculus]MBE9129194.1 hypothetical protein [Coleofasciculus sp. LEGE 07081]MBE9151853.1 hypothetical protein [Coleofasciculus sp. LEGE 07092]
MHFDWETFTYDSEWLREAVRIEDEADCDISAGFDWGANLGAVMAHPERYSQLARLRSIVIREFKELLVDWNLGVGAEAALICGRGLLMERLLHPTPEVQERLLAVLEKDLASPEGDSSSKPLRAGLQELLQGILTPEDWELIAVTAGNSVREQVIERVQTAKTA